MSFLAFLILLLPIAAKAQPLRPAASSQLSLAEIEEFLLKASIVADRELSPGAPKYRRRITLDDGKRKHDAAVETEDGTTPTTRNYRFNVAAFELDKALDLHMAAPSVLRTVNGLPASAMWWVDDVAMSERDRRSKRIEPPDPDSWNKQMQAVRVFDELMSNPYRNTSPEDPSLSTSPDSGHPPDDSWVELLITRAWRVWLIDHTGTFRTRKQLRHLQSLTQCDRGLLRKLQELNKEAFLQKLGKYLSPEQLDALEVRRTLIVKRFQELIASKGEGAVLYDLPQRQ